MVRWLSRVYLEICVVRRHKAMVHKFAGSYASPFGGYGVQHTTGELMAWQARDKPRTGFALVFLLSATSGGGPLSR